MGFRKSVKTSQIISGTFGRLWINGQKAANVKSFEAKITYEWEDVDISEKLGKGRKLLGYEIEGTAVLHKTDSEVIALYGEGAKKGNPPEVSLVSSVDDPASIGGERIQYLGVTFDELQLAKFEQKTITEEEIPFKAEDYIALDLIKGE